MFKLTDLVLCQNSGQEKKELEDRNEIDSGIICFEDNYFTAAERV